MHTLIMPPFPDRYSLRLILVRHGEPEEQVKGKCFGRTDPAMSELGRVQIQAKLEAIRNFNVRALYTSPLKRASESAAIIGASLRLCSIVSPELQEINFGDFEGHSYGEIEEAYPQEYKLWMEHPTEIKFPGGESFAEMKARITTFQNTLQHLHRGETVVLVSHGGTNRILLAAALGLPDERVFRIDQAYGAINIIDYFHEYPVVRLVNG